MLIQVMLNRGIAVSQEQAGILAAKMHPKHLKQLLILLSIPSGLPGAIQYTSSPNQQGIGTHQDSNLDGNTSSP